MTGGDPLARSPVDDLAATWTAAWSAAGAFTGCCSAEITYEDPLAPTTLSGLAELEAHAVRLRDAFPDVRVEPTAPSLARGDHACIPWKLSGTNRGPLAMLPATDRPVALHGLHYLELSDGRVRRARGFLDLYDAATQLGVLPARGGFGEQALLMLRGFGLRR
ncbi:MAG: ester cyclase [Solirubrobacterales bacterium]|nr:ester cyclase [Solirubrobacterales bacterium]